MKLLVTGYNGQLGHDIVELAKKEGIEAIGLTSEDMDITDRKKVEEVMTKYRDVDAMIHCAAWTAVDKAEDEVEACRKVNRDGTENIVDMCRKFDIPMMYFSTDYIFDGEGDRPWKVDDHKDPLNVYGETKYEGEKLVETLSKYFIIRISWVFGVNGNNFINTMIRLGKEHGEVSVVSDQIGSPTYTKDLAKLALDMIQTDRYGVYHATNQGYCSWYDFACEIFKQMNMDVKVNPVTSDAFPTKAKRPKNSRMDQTCLTENGFDLLPTWQDALKDYLIAKGFKK